MTIVTAVRVAQCGARSIAVAGCCCTVARRGRGCLQLPAKGKPLSVHVRSIIPCVGAQCHNSVLRDTRAHAWSPGMHVSTWRENAEMLIRTAADRHDCDGNVRVCARVCACVRPAAQQTRAKVWTCTGARDLLLSTGWRHDVEDGFLILPQDEASQAHITNQSGVTSGFEMCFGPSTFRAEEQAPLVQGSQPKHVSNPA